MTAWSGKGRHRWLFHQHKAGALKIILAPRVQGAVSVRRPTDRRTRTAAAWKKRLPVNQTHRTATLVLSINQSIKQAINQSVVSLYFSVDFFISGKMPILYNSQVA